jgi:hypothetical protein
MGTVLLNELLIADCFRLSAIGWRRNGRDGQGGQGGLNAKGSMRFLRTGCHFAMHRRTVGRSDAQGGGTVRRSTVGRLSPADSLASSTPPYGRTIRLIQASP